MKQMRLGRRSWSYLNREERRALQFQLLKKVLREQIVPFSPFYRRLFDSRGIDLERLRSLDDLRRIPYTTKQDLLPAPGRPEAPREFVLQPDSGLIRTRLPLRRRAALMLRGLLGGRGRLEEALHREYAPSEILFTTGRSTGSVPFLLTPYDHMLMLECGRRLAAVLGVDPASDRMLNIFPYAPHLAFWQVVAAGQATGTLTLNTGGGRVMGTERLLNAMERLKPTLVAGMPGYFYHLLRTAVEQGRDVSSVRTVALGGENVPGGLKRKLAGLFESAGNPGVRVSSVLGFTEARQCWAECVGARRTGFHTSPDLGLFEIIDPESGEPLPEGETGELVYTALDGRGSMVVRYRTGDVVEGGITCEPCPGCGRTVPRISSSVRRVSNVKSLDIGKVKGTLVNFNSLSETLTGDPEIDEWQLEIRKHNDDAFETDEVMLYCSLVHGADPDAFRSRIQEAVHEAAEIHLNGVQVEDRDTLLRRVGMEELTKETRIVDRRGAAPVGKGGNPA